MGALDCEMATERPDLLSLAAPDQRHRDRRPLTRGFIGVDKRCAWIGYGDGAAWSGRRVSWGWAEVLGYRFRFGFGRMRGLRCPTSFCEFPDHARATLYETRRID